MLNFNSPELTKAVEKHHAVFEKHRQRLDDVSNDIRKAEQYLKSAGIPLPFRFLAFDDGDTKIYLAWNIYKDSGNDFRLVFQMDGDTEYQKPLIDAKVAIRLKLAEFLPAFLEALAKDLEK